MSAAIYFATSAELRRWFQKNHATATELSIGYYKTGTGVPSITWPQSVDQALCFGWIDGVRHGIDQERYRIRFTPRRPTSIWSSVNIRRIGELKRLGLIAPRGLAAFEARDPKRSGIYSFEQRKRLKLPPAFTSQLKGNKQAWAYFTSRPPWYQHAATHWIVSAKKDETRAKRLASLIECSEQGREVPPLARQPGRRASARQ